MLDLINDDRATEGLSPVAWDNFATRIAQAHAEDMAANGYMSHWNLSGEGPDIRYGLAGGTEVVQENVYMYWYRYDDGRPAPIEDWKKVVQEAQTSLMNSPGHRANIMSPEHTHVGIGIAYNPETGDVRIAQEFINRYVSLEPIPEYAKLGDTVVVAGELLPGASNPLINLAYEPFPTPVTIDWLDETSTYTSAAVFFEAIEPTVNADGHFSARSILDAEGQPGIYHIRIWVDVAGDSVPASDVIVSVTSQH
jgi:hypothetical protein